MKITNYYLNVISQHCITAGTIKIERTEEDDYV
jgi:hypothetical protein